MRKDRNLTGGGPPRLQELNPLEDLCVFTFGMQQMDGSNIQEGVLNIPGTAEPMPTNDHQSLQPPARPPTPASEYIFALSPAHAIEHQQISSFEPQVNQELASAQILTVQQESSAFTTNVNTNLTISSNLQANACVASTSRGFGMNENGPSASRCNASNACNPSNIGNYESSEDDSVSSFPTENILSETRATPVENVHANTHRAVSSSQESSARGPSSARGYESSEYDLVSPFQTENVLTRTPTTPIDNFHVNISQAAGQENFEDRRTRSLRSVTSADESMHEVEELEDRTPFRPLSSSRETDTVRGRPRRNRPRSMAARLYSTSLSNNSLESLRIQRRDSHNLQELLQSQLRVERQQTEFHERADLYFLRLLELLDHRN